METKTYRAIRHDVVRAKQKLLNTQVSVIGSMVAVAANGSALCSTGMFSTIAWL